LIEYIGKALQAAWQQSRLRVMICPRPSRRCTEYARSPPSLRSSGNAGRARSIVLVAIYSGNVSIRLSGLSKYERANSANRFWKKERHGALGGGGVGALAVMVEWPREHRDQQLVCGQ
jgi:hypothetical protein